MQFDCFRLLDPPNSVEFGLDIKKNKKVLDAITAICVGGCVTSVPNYSDRRFDL